MKIVNGFIVLLCLIYISQVSAEVEFDQNITPAVIFGSGNSNGSFTTNRANGIELGLRAKIPNVGQVNSAGDGRYLYTLSETDHDNNPATANRWNFDWTINTDFDESNGSELNQYTYELGMDADPGPGTDYLIFDPVTPTTETPFYDHSMGDNNTGNGQGVEATDGSSYTSLLATENVLQQSWRYSFFPQAPLDSFDPNAPGTYQVYLAIKDLNGQTLLRTEITVIIGGAAYDDNVTPEVIFGSGNANGSFTTKRANGLELGLRAKVPTVGNVNSLGDGRYLYTLDQTDHDNNSNTARRWNFDWTINTDFDDSNGTKLAEYTYELGLDADPSVATNYLVFDPVTPIPEIPSYDHSFGNNSTTNGGGVETNDGPTYLNLLNTENVLQQSWRYSFFPQSPLDSFNPDTPGTYSVYLAIKDMSGNVLMRNEIVVIITDGPSYDDNVTPEVIFGSGNSNGSFTINRASGLELGLRAKVPNIGLVNSTGDGRYQYSLAETDHDNNPATDNRWNFDWTVNTDFDGSNGSELNQYSYEIGMDADPSIETNYLVFDPVTPSQSAPFYDHSIGNNSTLNGGGIEATNSSSYLNLLATGNVLQQSWRYAFFPQSPLDGFNPNIPGTYNVYLAIKDLNGNTLLRTEIVVVIEGPDYDDNVTNEVIFGSGNANGSFTVDRKSSVEVALRAKIPMNGNINSNGDGTYSYTLAETDHDNNPGTDNRWNFDWSINTDYDSVTNNKVNQYTYEMGLDADPGLGTNFLVFDPITPTTEVPLYDHAFGDNSTANGAGSVANSPASYLALLANSNLVQQSWRYSFFPLSPLDSFNPNVPGNYVVYLAVKDGNTVVAKSEIQVLIGGAPENTIPVTAPDHYSSNEDSELSVNSVLGLLVNDFDADGSLLRVSQTGVFQTDGIGGYITVYSDGSFAYVPPQNLNGVATFDYLVTDGVNSVPARLTINVNPVNDSPDFSYLGDVVFYNITANNPLVAVYGYTFDYLFGPADENNQSVLNFSVDVTSDSDDIVNQVIATNDGFLIVDYTTNYGTALLEINMQDNGGTESGGIDTSMSKSFTVSNIDLIYANGFEPTAGFALLSYIDSIQFQDPENEYLMIEIERPYYHFASNSIWFLGHQLSLGNDYQSRSVIMLVESWLKEVLKSEGLSYRF